MSVDLAAVKRHAVNRARELGAAAVRIAPAHPDEEARERMQAAFARGDFETWRYDDEYARRAANPGELLAGAQSVICIALPYATGERKGAPLRGRVSNYAWSRDYHGRMRTLLAGVAACIDEAAGAPATAIACDTRPLAERAYAARSGVGWIGKHTNLIAPGIGSYVFLGEIVTTLALPPDEPLKKSCGSCARCVDACPTQALRGDYTIDATLCISDLTQRRDGIPRDMRAAVGLWVWGCDICQMVCPPTQNAGANATEAFAPFDEETAVPALVRLLRLTRADFETTYARTAMGWRGAPVLRRNAAVALGNALDRSTAGALALALREDPSAMVRGHVAWALGRIGSPSALSALRGRYVDEPDESVREEIRAALAPFSSDAPMEII